MSTAALARVEDHLKQRYIDAGRFPGTQLTVYRRGKIVHSNSQGFADLERKVPVKDDTIFRIYSMTKPITSVAFMMLFEEGRARSTNRYKYIPQWRIWGVRQRHGGVFKTKPPARPMLIVDLLWHTSGFTPRLPAALQRRCRLSRKEDRRGRDVGTLDSMIASRANAAGVLTGRPELPARPMRWHLIGKISGGSSNS